MLIYNLLYFSIPIISAISMLFKQSKKIFLFITGCIMIGLLTFRGINVGSDTITYYNIFNWSRNINLFEAKQSNIELGYLLLNRVIHNVNGNFTLLLFIIALLTILGIFQFIENFSSNILMSMLIFVGFTYYFMTFNITRQFLAISFDLIASTYLIKGKKWTSLLFIFIAGSIHNAGYLYLVLWILVNIKFSKRIFFASLSVIGIMSIPFTHFIESYMNNDERYNAIVNASNTGKGIFGIVFAILLLVLLFALIINFNFKDSNLFDRYIIYSFTLIVILNLLGIYFNFLGRLRYSFEIIIVIIIPYLIREYNLKKYSLVIGIIIFIAGLLIMNILIPNNIFYGIVPYSTQY